MKLVTGMHRSGTSLLAQELKNLGLDFGNHNDFISKDKWNSGGILRK